MKAAKHNNFEIKWDQKHFQDAELSVALVEPEIPGNAGSIARTCVATQTPLIIVGPIPFQIDDKRIRRAGLDYWPHLFWNFCENRDQFHDLCAGRRLVLTSARAGEPFHKFEFQKGDILVFGKETRGLDDSLIEDERYPLLNIPMRGATRSINLANAATLVLYKAYESLGTLDYFEQQK